MTQWTRRDVLKAGVASAITPLAASTLPSAPAFAQAVVTGAPDVAATGTLRERLLLDFGWLFRLGNAWDTTKDFGFGTDTFSTGMFAKSGRLVAPGKVAGPSF